MARAIEASPIEICGANGCMSVRQRQARNTRVQRVVMTMMANQVGEMLVMACQSSRGSVPENAQYRNRPIKPKLAAICTSCFKREFIGLAGT